MLAEVKVFDPQVSDLLRTGPGVVEEEQQGVIPQAETPFVGQRAKQRLGLVTLKEVGLSRSRALHWDGGDPLAYVEHLRGPCGDVVEERVEAGEALVARADMVMTINLEITKEPDDTARN